MLTLTTENAGYVVILVTGGRSFSDYNSICVTLNHVTEGIPKDRIIIVHGNADGADRLADRWCLDNGIHVARCPALWKTYPVSAGPKRNKAMLFLRPNKVVAFPGGRGTAHMVKLAMEAGIEVLRCVP